MNLLTGADCKHRIATILNTLGVTWERVEHDKAETVDQGPTEVPRAHEKLRQDEKGVTYTVGDGPLEGTWEASGADADLLIFDRMLTQLDEDWRFHIGKYSIIASAMRSVGR